MHDQRNKPRVLIVDDDRDTREMYVEWLRANGFESSEAANANDALRAARSFRPGVVVTDLRLQGSVDGVELTRRLRSDRRTEDIRIIMLTGATMDDERERAKASGVDAFVVKPCLPDALVSEIRRVSESSMGVL